MDKESKSHKWREKLDIYLLLFPYDNKKEFVVSLHNKLKAGQNI